MFFGVLSGIGCVFYLGLPQPFSNASFKRLGSISMYPSLGIPFYGFLWDRGYREVCGASAE